MIPAILVAWLAVAGDMPPPNRPAAPPAKPSAPDVTVPVQCSRGTCVIDQAFLMELVEAHNAQVDRIRELEGAKDCPAPKLKKERDL